MIRISQICGLINCFVILTALLVGCGGQKLSQEEANKTLVLRFWQEGWKQGNQAVFNEICAPGYVNHDPTVPQVTDLETYKQHVDFYATAFPTEVGVEIEDMMAQLDKVVVRWMWHVTHQGEYMGLPPTGNSIVMTGITFHRLAEGRVVESWHHYDALGFMQQLGAVPPMGRENFTWTQPVELVPGASCAPDAKEAIYRREAELWNQKNLGIADEVFATDFANHDPSWPGVTDLESFKEWATGWLSAAPDLEIVIEDVVTAGDKVAGRWISRWTDVAGIAGSEPTGKQIEVTGMDICRIAGGKIVERWWAKDVFGAMQQLGVLPPPGESRK
jgi:steroid delta-isomerase-like uncharacterized protein